MTVSLIKHGAWPALVADIGGTNARFGIVSHPGAAAKDVATLPTADYQSIEAAIARYLDHHASEQPRSACLAVAGPVTGDLVKFSNMAWSFSASAVAQRFGFAPFAVLNDFQALALALPHLTESDLHAIGGGQAQSGKALAVIGPGTGLGVAGLLPVGPAWVPVSGEGGHVDLAPVEDLEIEVLRRLREQLGRVSAENVLSGAGLERLYAALAHILDRKCPPLSAAEITNTALAGGSDDQATCALLATEMFCALTGAFASNVALTMGARGGVFIGGGILPRLVPMLHKTAFRARFDAKGQMADYTSTIPVRLITARTPALTGAAAWIAGAALPANAQLVE